MDLPPVPLERRPAAAIPAGGTLEGGGETKSPGPPAGSPSARPSRIGELDALRGLAALAVVFHHLTRRYYEDFGRPPDALPLLPFHGTQGVFLFFIISGFVITQTLEKVRRPGDFIVSRFSRIYPAFWFGVLLTWGAMEVFGLPGREVGVGEALVNLTMLQDHFHVRQVDYVYWSLTYELTFYALAFIAHVRGWLSRHPHRCAWAWLAYSAVFVLLKRGAGFELPSNVIMLTLPNVAPLFVAGVMFRLMHAGRGGRQAYAVLACCFVLHNAWNWSGKTGIALTAGMFAVFLLMLKGRLGVLRARPLLFLGAISYPLYLLHDNLGMVMLRELMSAGIGYRIALVLAIAAILGLSAAATWGVERPALKWIRRRFAAAPAA